MVGFVFTVVWWSGDASKGDMNALKARLLDVVKHHATGVGVPRVLDTVVYRWWRRRCSRGVCRETFFIAARLLLAALSLVHMIRFPARGSAIGVGGSLGRRSAHVHTGRNGGPRCASARGG